MIKTYVIYIYTYIHAYLDLHLALFSAHSSFHLDLRSFWLFMLTWTRKRAFVSWRTGIYAFFPGIYAYFPGKYAHIFGFKMHQVQKCQKWCNYAHVEKNRSKSRNLANEHLFVLFWGYRYTYVNYRSRNLRSRSPCWGTDEGRKNAPTRGGLMLTGFKCWYDVLTLFFSPFPYKPKSKSFRNPKDITSNQKMVILIFPYGYLIWMVVLNILFPIYWE